MVDVNRFRTSLQGLLHTPKDEEAVLTADNHDSLKEGSIQNLGLMTEAFHTTVGLEVIYVEDLKRKIIGE